MRKTTTVKTVKKPKHRSNTIIDNIFEKTKNSLRLWGVFFLIGLWTLICTSVGMYTAFEIRELCTPVSTEEDLNQCRTNHAKYVQSCMDSYAKLAGRRMGISRGR
jgi:hypothetical protein